MWFNVSRREVSTETFHGHGWAITKRNVDNPPCPRPQVFGKPVKDRQVRRPRI